MLNFKASINMHMVAFWRLPKVGVSSSFRVECFLFIFATLFNLCTPPCSAQTLPASIEWEELGPKLERAEFSFNVGAVFTSSILLVRAELHSYKLRTIRASEFGWKRATVRTLCRAAGATTCINSNFFDEQGRALGLVISRGIIHQKLHRSGSVLTGVLYSTAKQTKISQRELFSPSVASAGQAIEASQAGPRLIENGEPIRGLHDQSLSSNLSGACLDSKGKIIFYRVTSGVFGCTIRQLQNVLLNTLIGCVDAINFDGGGSSQFYLSDEIPGRKERRSEEFLSGLDPVPVAMGLFSSVAK